MFDFNMDAHMHFDLYKDRTDVLDYIEKNKSYTIAVTNLPELYEKYSLQYSKYKYVKIALGFHPELVRQYKNQLNLFAKLCKDVRYIGEIGLDYTDISDNEKKNQLEIFRKIIEICNSNNKILSVHSRRASTDVINELDTYNGKVIMHWFTGKKSDLDKAVKKGYYFSINSQMIKSMSGKDIINRIPVDRILLESDAPFTKGMEDKYKLDFIDEIYQHLAVLYNQDIENVKKRIKANFASLTAKDKLENSHQ
jgi:TatD DNase family protein